MPCLRTRSREEKARAEAIRYLGGKYRLAKPIADEIYARAKPGDTYLEPFMGGGALFTGVLARGWGGDVYMGDANRALVSMWQAVQMGWDPPADLTQEDYLRYRVNPDPEDARTAYLAFGGSFGAMWFGSRTFYPDQLAATRRSLLATQRVLLARRGQRTQILPLDYRDWTDMLGRVPRAVVYCDPPYANTETYAGADEDITMRDPEAFDYAEFWRTMRTWASYGHTVLVSEYTGGPGAEQLWERTMKGKMTKRSAPGSKIGAAQDRLFLVRA